MTDRIELRPSAARRFFGVGVLYALGAMVIVLALREALGLPSRLALLALGAGALWAGEALRRATRQGVVLTPEGLFDTRGVVIAPMDQIAAVDRGTFAFKPSNGFLVRLESSAGPGHWAPGLWWRRGRRVGVGGVTAAHGAKAMAEEISLRLASRAAKG